MPGPTPDNTSLFPGVPDRVANLVVRYYDTNLSDEETAELRQGLTQHPAARGLFVRWGLQIQTLTESLAPQYSESDDSISFEELVEMEARAQAELVEIDAKPRGQLVDIFKPSHGSPRLAMRDLRLASIYLLRHALTSRLTIGSAIAAVLLLGLFVINPFARDTPNQTEVADNTPATPADSAPLNPRDRAVATLTASHNAQWAQHPAEGASAPGSLTPGTLTPGSKLHPNQRLTLTQGFAEITTNEGAIAMLEAPATIELLNNDNALHLHSGKLVGICETQASKGFLVRTPHMDITDLGTRFGVDRSNPRVTAVHVFDGEVVARQPNRLDNQAVYLTKGQSASASHGRREVVQTTQSLEKIKRFSNIAISQGMLPGTGVGLRVGQVDPNWAVVEMDGRVLDTPRPVEVITAPQYTGPLFDASHLKGSQMVGFVPDHGADPNQPYVFQTSFDIPESIDIDSTVLQLRYAADIYLEWVRINGQRLRLDHAATGWGRFEQSTITQHLQPGKNTIAFEVSNFNPRSESEVDLGAVGLRLEWSLRSVSTANPTTDGGGP